MKGAKVPAASAEEGQTPTHGEVWGCRDRPGGHPRPVVAGREVPQRTPGAQDIAPRCSPFLPDGNRARLSTMWYPLTFRPLFMERVWGGRRLADLFGKALPAGAVIGESWEVCDRPDAASVVDAGPMAGRTLRGLMASDGPGILGRPVAPGERFPWLCKLLDAREDLSLQVHPPAGLAAALGGEPKTEMWYVAAAEPGSVVYAGIRPGVTRDAFAARAADGTVAGCFHRLPVAVGDVLFLPSGRVHALGAGIVIFEIQQNSDTTYRVFDWNRVGLDGRPRELHLGPALQSIDFSDTAPALASRATTREGAFAVRRLVEDPLFRIAEHSGAGEAPDPRRPGQPALLAAVRGTLRLSGGGRETELGPGSFALLPAALGRVRIETVGGPAIWLSTLPG